MRHKRFSKSLLTAVIPGALLPLFFFLLGMLTLSGSGRDQLPRPDNFIGAISICGLALSSIPAILVAYSLMLLINALHDHVYAIPLLDLLAPSAQVICIWVLGYLSNVLIWWAAVSFFQRHKPKSLSLSSSLDAECENNSNLRA